MKEKPELHLLDPVRIETQELAALVESINGHVSTAEELAEAEELLRQLRAKRGEPRRRST